MYDVDFREPTILALGGEKSRLSGAIREICNWFVTIPTVGASSLSLTHAAAIVAAEAYRQRRRVPDVAL